MKSVNRKSTSPVRYPQSRRNHPIMHLSSLDPGVAHPVAFIPMLREDALTGVINNVSEMLETKELLLNDVTARLTAWVFPFLAADRFQSSRDEFDRSYMEENSLDGTGVTPFIENEALPAGGAGAVPLYKAAGLHGKAGDQVNTMYREAYNAIYNHRARQQSRKLTPRLLTDTTLAPAFWHHRQFPHIVAEFDRAMIEGQVALKVVEAKLPVSGIGVNTNAAFPVAGGNFKDSSHNSSLGEVYPYATSAGTAGVNTVYFRGNGPNSGYTLDIYAEMAENSIAVSLAGLEEARKLQSFARLRTQFEGHDDEYIIDMLMQGLSVPDQHLKQPFQIGEQTVRFSQGKRYATDSGNLDDSATSGFTKAGMRLRCPRINTGGVVVVLLEIVPQQLWERQQDWFFHTRPAHGRPGHDYWPDAERDTLDQQKIDVVYNRDIDVTHADPTGYFGFEPMNAKFNRAAPTIGGKFHRPAADAPTDDARKRLWAVEGVNPALTDTFYIVKPGTMHKKPFLDEVSHPFEIVAKGNCVLTGNTQFGGMLIEATGNYDAVAEHAPKEQIEQEDMPA